MSRPLIAPSDVISTVTGVIQQIIQAQVFFPAKTFQDAVEKATKNIFAAQTEQVRAPLIEVVSVYAFSGQALYGNAALPDFVNRLGELMAQAAVPLWALSLAILGIAALTRNAVGLGYGTGDVAGEAARWFFVALASGNGIAIVNLTHNGFGALTGAVIGLGGMASAAQLVNGFIPTASAAGILPLLMLVVGVIIGVITIVVLAVTYIARYALLLAVAGLAPLAIACEGIPFTRFVFRDWLSMFLRLELLQVVNAFILVLFANFGAFMVTRGGVVGSVMSLVMMLGLSSAIISVNTGVFRQVFGTALDAAAQVKAAGDQLMRVVGAVAGVALTASSGVPVGSLGVPTTGTNASNSANSDGVYMPSRDSSGAGEAGTGSGSASGPGTVSALVQAVGRATGNPLLRGFTEGAAYDQQVSSVARMANQHAESAARRAEQLAREMGATDAGDIDTISASVTAPYYGRSPEDMRRAHRENAPLLRSMARQYGSAGRAAAVAGYGSFGQMANALAEERLGPSAGDARGIASTPGPIKRWTDSPPDFMQPGGQHLLPYDFGVGASIALGTNGNPSNAPHWSQTAHSLRQAYGVSYVQGVLSRLREESLSEREVMALVDRQVETHPPLGGVVSRFWIPDVN
jgi:hypothetical protein